VTKWDIRARIGYWALRIAQSTERKAQDGLRTSDSGSPHHPLGFEVRLQAKSVTQGPAIVRIVRRPHRPEGPHHGHDPNPDGIGQAVPDGLLVQPSQAGSFGHHQPPNRSARLGGHQWGCLALPGWCVSRRGKIQIPNPEKYQEPIVDSGSTPLGALRGWATPTAAPSHWLEHRLHKPDVAEPADDRGTPTHPS